MGDFSLYGRMLEHGTLAEAPGDIPDARFALPSTIHWMRGLAILAEASDAGFLSARAFHASVPRRVMADREINTVCEQMLFALHQLAALAALELAPNKADVARIGIVTWYYGIYGAASAMIAAGDGSFPDTHAATAQQWDRQFAANGLVVAPFADRLSNLTDVEVKKQLAGPRGRGKHSLTIKPASNEQAWGCIAEYLAGTADWEQWNIRERVRASREFRDLGADSFRTAARPWPARYGLCQAQYRLSASGLALSRKGQLSRRHLSRLRQVCAPVARRVHCRSRRCSPGVFRHGGGLLRRAARPSDMV